MKSHGNAGRVDEKFLNVVTLKQRGCEWKTWVDGNTQMSAMEIAPRSLCIQPGWLLEMAPFFLTQFPVQKH